MNPRRRELALQALGVEVCCFCISTQPWRAMTDREFAEDVLSGRSARLP